MSGPTEDPHLIHPALGIPPFLPNELLEQIFLAACDGEYLLDLVSARRSPPIQHVLSRICRHWRALALSSVTLWSSIHVTNHGGYYLVTSSALQRKFLSMALRRSGTALINCKVAISSNRMSSDHIIAVLQDLFRTSNRWRSLDIRVTNLPYHILLPLQNNLAELQTLSRMSFGYTDRTMEGSSAETEAGLSRLFSCAPRLSNVHFSNKPFVYDLPFRQIRKFTLTRTLPSDEETACLIPYLTKLSTASPDLDTLDIDGFYKDLNIDPTQSPILFPNLRNLLLRQVHLLDKLLAIIHLPALSSVHLSSRSMHTPMKVLIELIPRCRCDIRNLHIEFKTEGQLRGGRSSLRYQSLLFGRLVPHVPMLEALHVKVGVMHDALMETLLRFIEAPNTLPHLRALSIVGRLPLLKFEHDIDDEEEKLFSCIHRFAITEDVIRTRSEWCTKPLESISVSLHLRVTHLDQEKEVEEALREISELPAFRAMASMKMPRVTLRFSCERKWGDPYWSYELIRRERTFHTPIPVPS